MLPESFNGLRPSSVQNAFDTRYFGTLICESCRFRYYSGRFRNRSSSVHSVPRVCFKFKIRCFFSKPERLKGQFLTLHSPPVKKLRNGRNFRFNILLSVIVCAVNACSMISTLLLRFETIALQRRLLG